MEVSIATGCFGIYETNKTKRTNSRISDLERDEIWSEKVSIH